jgi:MFS family permease
VVIDNYETMLGLRRPRFIHAFILLAASCVPVLAIVLIAPVLPKIQAHFAGVPRVDVLVPVALTIPALAVGILAPFAGAIVDSLGRKRLLVFAMPLYAAFGVAPLWLDSLYLIILSRLGVGVTEAVIMTCCTALIGDYYTGVQRDKYLSLQTTFHSICAIVFILIGGALGEVSWRAPFYVYAVGLLLVPMMQRLLWEPRPPEPSFESSINVREPDPTPPPFQLPLLVAICAITFIGSIAFFVVPVHLAYLFEALGLHSTRIIGVAIGVHSATILVGTFIFRGLSGIGLRVPKLLALSFLTAGVGFLMMARATTTPSLMAGVIVNSLGSGVLLPTLLTWNMRLLSFERRGLGTGAWVASFSLGQFFNPIVVISLAGILGGRADVIWLFGWALISATGIFLGVKVWTTSPHSA